MINKMVVIESANFYITEPTVVAIGKFDGVHLGHMEIVKEMLELKKKGLYTCILTFDISPQAMLSGDFSEKMLMTNDEKKDAFSELGIDYYIELPFEQVRGMQAEEFLREVVKERLNASVLVCGHDLRFGKDGLGNVNTVKSMEKELNLKLYEIDKVNYEDEEISSSMIRNMIDEGRMELADSLLYHKGSI